jgi:hypothetical protein
LLVIGLCITRPHRLDAQSGADLYRFACAACHAEDGRGEPRSVVGFDTPLPDFTDCAFVTSEPDVDWNAVVHLGGPARALDRRMPAFGEALPPEDIQRVIEYVRGFCKSRAWPHGNLNLPRPLVTEKAFPENEVIVSVASPEEHFIETRLVYERRIGSRSQVEFSVPFNVTRAFGAWQRGLGDVAAGFKQVLWYSTGKGSILSAGVEMTFPTGKESLGLGHRLRVFEPFVVYSQRLPSSAFLHAQVGIEKPLNLAVKRETFWRVAAGKTFVQGPWGRAWSPLIELLATREFVPGEPELTEVLPQLRVTLSRRHHVSFNGGVRVPVSVPSVVRRTSLIGAVFWDWYEGSLFEGWR